MTAPDSRSMPTILPSRGLEPDFRQRFYRPVFIVAAPRSGSTLLFETLAANSAFSTLGGEAHWLVESMPELRPGAIGVDSNRLIGEHCTPLVASRITSTVSDRLVDAKGAPVTGNQSVRFLEKTPKNSLRIPFFLRVFPDARFIFLWRDPRENMSSIMEAWRDTKWVTYRDLPGWRGAWSLLLPPGWESMRDRPLETVAAFQWAVTNRIILNDLAALPKNRWTALSYADFLSDPQMQVRRLCEFAEVPFEEEFARGLESPLPLSRYTQTVPREGKWLKNKPEILRVLPSVEPIWERLKALSDTAGGLHPDRLLSSGNSGAADVSEAINPLRQHGKPDAEMCRYALYDKKDVFCSVTSRMHGTGTSMRNFFNRHYGFMPLSHVTDTFGFVEEYTELYGGRQYNPRNVLNRRDIEELYDLGIGVKLCLQNHFITKEDCEANRAFLARYHRKGNVIICASEILARFVKEKFPDYVVEASIIKEVHDLATIAECLELFDLFTLPPAANDNLDFLASLPSKDRFILFGNARCLYTCKPRNCYRNNSVVIRRASNPDFGTLGPACSPTAPNKFEYTLFDLERFYEMGFRRFKWIIPEIPLHCQASLKPGTYSTKDGSLLRISPGTSRS